MNVPWGSRNFPGCANSGLVPGVPQAPAASVEVPVLIAMGERDVCADPFAEIAAFSRARNIALYVVPSMAHMRNFACTRLWRRLERFAEEVAADRIIA